MRLLTTKEDDLLDKLVAEGIEVALLEPTATGLSKSILDATQPVRRFLKDLSLHDYDTQRQGPENKSTLPAEFFVNNNVQSSLVSLYRPKTKQGDPRIWFKGLPSISKPNDIIAFSFDANRLKIINLTKLSYSYDLEAIVDFLGKPKQSDVSKELLTKIQAIASRGFIETSVAGDTAVGRLLETELGIQINSRQTPDYRGIELKSHRQTVSRTRRTLFAQVPDWSISKYKSSREIIESFGYYRGDVMKLYCTLSSRIINSQGLGLRLNSGNTLLSEFSSDESIGNYAAYSMDKLQTVLKSKHAETFWVKAESKRVNGKEYIRYVEVEYTKGPLLSQLPVLINDGRVTVDHLIKKTPIGRVNEKGPLFKLEHDGLDSLFPKSQIFKLV